MERFDNYKIRLIYNYLKYKDTSSPFFEDITFYIKNIQDIVYVTCTFIIIDGTYFFNRNQHITNHYDSTQDKINTLQLILEHFLNFKTKSHFHNLKRIFNFKLSLFNHNRFEDL